MAKVLYDNLSTSEISISDTSYPESANKLSSPSFYEISKNSVYVDMNAGVVYTPNRFDTFRGSDHLPSIMNMYELIPLLSSSFKDISKELKNILAVEIALRADFLVLPYSEFLSKYVIPTVVSSSVVGPSSVSLWDWIKKFKSEVLDPSISTDRFDDTDPLNVIYNLLQSEVRKFSGTIHYSLHNTKSVEDMYEAQEDIWIKLGISDSTQLIDILREAKNKRPSKWSEMEQIVIPLIKQYGYAKETIIPNFTRLRESLVGDDPDYQSTSLFVSDPSLVSDPDISSIITDYKSSMVGYLPMKDPQLNNSLIKSLVGQSTSDPISKIYNSLLPKTYDSPISGELSNSDYRIFMRKTGKVLGLPTLEIPRLKN